ncbi:MAG: YwiC-like family protein [Nostocales cyanobacterium 94392]|nr:YwiC-like family protein [Nostocales cyanobacterium 94392]
MNEPVSVNELGTTVLPSEEQQQKVDFRGWLKPTFSPEHGVLIILFGSFLTGAALAQTWNYCTNLALICAFFALQTEHPLIVQLKQRSTWKPRYLIWAGIYGIIAVSLAVWLWIQSPILVWIYAIVLCALIVDMIAVFKRKHKSILNELVIFAAICLSTPLTYAATTGNLSLEALAMWILNTLFFGSAIFTIKLRRKKTSSLNPGIIYHSIASAIAIGFFALGWLKLVTALAFAIALIKFAVVITFRNWYTEAKFHSVALLESRFALFYIAVAAISVLPAHLPK